MGVGWGGDEEEGSTLTYHKKVKLPRGKALHPESFSFFFVPMMLRCTAWVCANLCHLVGESRISGGCWGSRGNNRYFFKKRLAYT